MEKQKQGRMPAGYYFRNFLMRVGVEVGYVAFLFCCWLGWAFLAVAKRLQNKHRK